MNAMAAMPDVFLKRDQRPLSGIFRYEINYWNEGANPPILAPSKPSQFPGPMTDCPHMRVTDLQLYPRLGIIFFGTYGTAWSAPA